jgi:dimethylamine/trimethylamine dehydrogenase
VTHEPIPGAVPDGARVLTPEQIMVGGARPHGRDVVVYDCDGYFMAPGLAELLATEGYSVRFVTPLSQVAPFCDSTLEGSMLRQRLHEAGIAFCRSTTVTAIGTGRLAALDEFGEPVGIDCHAVVLVTQRCSEDDLYRQLVAEAPDVLAAAGIRGLYRIGDCVAPRMLADAVFDGHRLGREIDSPDPARPLPYLRERVLRATIADLSEAFPAKVHTGRPEQS